MTCDISEERLQAYAIGAEATLHVHVSDCGECQDRLAVIWGADSPDVSGPTMRAVRIEAFTRDTIELSARLIGDFFKALVLLVPVPRKEPE